MSKIIYQGTPSLPHTFNFSPDTDSEVILMLQGSAWASKANVVIGFRVKINGVEAVTSTVWSNGTTTHRATNIGLAAFSFPLSVHDGVIAPVSIEVLPWDGNTIFDVNDKVTLAVLGCGM